MSALMQFGDAPFVLFEDARPGGDGGRVFSAPVEIITAYKLADVDAALEAVRAGLRRGFYAAGWLSYEAGIAFEPRLMQRISARVEHREQPLLWFGLFERAGQLTRAEIERALPDPAGAHLSAPRPRISREAYEAAFNRSRDYIAEGDIYQINLSYRADLTILGHPLAAYARVRQSGQGGWSSAVHDGASWLLSTSPELFFRMSNGAIEARPMKGTAKRRADAAEDHAAAEALRHDPKETAENVMIVDLLRNDISRIAKRGSVRVPELFTVETYPTLHTLTSTVRADLRDDVDPVDALRALFPCGSITGAPKIRAMEIIAELETDQRGAYTGSIGWMAPDGSAEFNVAIRTIAVDANGNAELGLGSAIVYDSTAVSEWEECRTKGAFVTAGAPTLELFETMRAEQGNVALLDLHMARLGASARMLGFTFDEASIRAELLASLADVSAPCVARLSLAQSGATKIERRAMPSASNDMRVFLTPMSIARDDFRLRHKTTSRAFYDDARVQSGADEVVFVDADGFITEGSISNVFVERDGILLTPPLARGLLPGVLRASLLASRKACEADLTPADLANGFFIGNAVRGLVPAKLIANTQERAA